MKENCSLETDRSVLIFGMRNGRYGMEYRCPECEKKVMIRMDEIMGYDGSIN